MLNDVYEAPTWAWSFSQCLRLPGGQHNGITLYLNSLLWCSWRPCRNTSRLKFKVRTKKGDRQDTWEVVPILNQVNQWAVPGQFHLISAVQLLSSTSLVILYPAWALPAPYRPEEDLTTHQVSKGYHNKSPFPMKISQMEWPDSLTRYRGSWFYSGKVHFKPELAWKSKSYGHYNC